jgi:hypothetical protein
MSSRKTTLSGVTRGPIRRGLAASLALLGVLAFAPAIAQAGVIASAGPTFPSTVTVGQTGLAASVTLENRNTPPDDVDTNTVCNAGEASPPCALPERGIVLTPTCKQVASGQCTAAGADPGVFALSATGIGRTGTSCPAMVFNIAIVDTTFGTVRFTPQPVGAHVTLPGFGSSCVIDFTFDVLKSPTGDQNPAVPGNQTAQATEHTQFAGPFGPGALSNFARGTSNGTTVLRAGPPTITTAASGDITLGGQLTDQATVTGLVNPVAGATVTFRLYAPSDSTCTGTPEFTNTKPVALSGTTATATSDAFTPTGAGVYHWVATYDGDADNLPISGTCGEATETRTVSATTQPPPVPQALTTPPPPPPPPATTAPPAPAAPSRSPARGVANISSGGHTGCAGTPFPVSVTGTGVRRVVFTLDGKRIATLTRPNRANRFSVLIRPGKLKRGTHRVQATVTYVSSTQTRPKTLRVVFSRCARAAPQFTG